jgi:hypothetical protein
MRERMTRPNASDIKFISLYFLASPHSLDPHDATAGRGLRFAGSAAKRGLLPLFGRISGTVIL